MCVWASSRGAEFWMNIYGQDELAVTLIIFLFDHFLDTSLVPLGHLLVAHWVCVYMGMCMCVCVLMMYATGPWQQHPAPAVGDKLWLVRNDACKPLSSQGTEAHQHQQAGRMLSKHPCCSCNMTTLLRLLDLICERSFGYGLKSN